MAGPDRDHLPGVVTGGTIRTAANLDHSWIGIDAVAFLGEATGQPVTVINDADAAGIAEMRFGAGKDEPGTVLLLTLGTGIGSALFYNGVLVPNTEFGHIEIHGKDAETRASERAREEGDLSWGKWADRVDEYLDKMEALLSAEPDHHRRRHQQEVGASSCPGSACAPASCPPRCSTTPGSSARRWRVRRDGIQP